ncbi:ABC transporter ATP-binding protein [Patescibacteria group bacterium]|nr:ABC transporter ATP-binding protein [Patescibacteria group bacterium]
MLQIKNIKKYFGGVKAIDNCSFEVQKNTITALIGPNGAGKSTVFNLISGTSKPDHGKVYFEKQDITNHSVEDISNSGISRLFQQARLFDNLSIKDNLYLALDNEDQRFWKNLLQKNKFNSIKENKIKEALKEIEMEDKADYLCGDLSYGQKRLVELMRTVLNPHSFLMLDEPVAGVNPKLRNKIKEILLDLKEKGETILLIEHDMNFTLAVSDWVVVMENGRVLFEGTPEEVKNNEEVLRAYFGN